MYENSDKFGLPLYAATSFGATGATTLVAAPGTGVSIAVDGLYSFISVDTAGKHDSYFYAETITTGIMFRTLQAQTTGAVPLNADLQTPWMLETNSSLRCSMSLTAASTPGLHIAVRYRLVRRNG